MKLTERDTKILAFALIVIMAAFFYFVPYKQLEAQKAVLDGEVQQLTAIYTQLAQDIEKKDVFKASIEETKKQLEIYNKLLPSGVLQEAILYQLNDIENAVGIHFPDLVLGPVVTLFTINEEQPVEGQAPTPVDPAAAIGQVTAIKRDLSVTTTLTYSQLKALLIYLYKTEGFENFKTRVVLNNLKLTSVLESSDLTADFDLSFYGVLNDLRGPEIIDLGDFDRTKSDVFLPYQSYGSGVVIPDEVTRTQEPYADLFVTLNPVNGQNPTVTLGRTNDSLKESYLYAYLSEVVPVEIEFYQEEDIYYYRYRMDVETYPKVYDVGIAFDPGLFIEVQILSGKRSGSEDKSGANATIINNTDMPVSIVYSNEDETNPRLNIVKIQGDVIIQ